MTSIAQSQAEMQDRFIEGIKQTQTVVLDAVKTWSDAAARYTPAVPDTLSPLATQLPSAQELIKGQFEFAERLLRRPA